MDLAQTLVMGLHASSMKEARVGVRDDGRSRMRVRHEWIGKRLNGPK